MQNGHGKMDERGKKFSSAFTSKTPTFHHLHTSPSSSIKLRRYHHHHHQGEETTPSDTWIQASQTSYFTMSPISSSSTEQYHQAEDITGYEDEEDNSGSSTGRFSPTITSCPSSRTNTQSNNAASTTTTLQVNLAHSTRTQGLHHRSRIKDVSSLLYFEESPLAKQIDVERRRRRKRRSSTHSSSSSSSNSTPASSSSFSSPTSSRFLLTFLSSCHLVQVTSRLLVALAMTSLFLVLVHVMPGAYCSSSTMSMYSSSASSSSSLAAGAATRRAYFNQSVHPLKAHKPSSSSVVATGDHRNPAFWINTKWPTMRSSPHDDNVVVEIENVNNKLYSNQLAVATNTDYDNQNKIRNGENISAKNDLITSIFKRNKNNMIGNSPAIGSSNDKARNNEDKDFNGNNNRSNYYYDSFVDSTASASSQNQSSFSSIANNAKRNYSVNNRNINDINNIQNTQQQPENRGTTIYYELESDKNLMGDFDLENEERGEQRASTAKIGGNTASHGKGGSSNGTTKAERDSVVNVSSTGVRPTMAFTNSYYGRQPFRNEGEKRRKEYGQVAETGDEESYGNHEDDEMMQADQSHPFEDNNQEKAAAVNDDDDFRESKNWSNEKSQINNRYGTIISHQNEHSREVFSLHQQPQHQAHHHLSSGPTAKTTTTTTTKHFKTSASTTAAGGSSSSSVAASTLFYSPPSPSSSSSSSTTSKVKSIKSSEHLSAVSASSSTVTVHYPNEKGSSSSSRSITASTKASSITLSNQNPSYPHHHQNHNNNSLSSKDSETHHHHHYHLNNRLEQPHQQHPAAVVVGFGTNQVLNFGVDYVGDEEDEIVDEHDDHGANAIEDIDAVLEEESGEHQHQYHHDKSNTEKVENDIVGKSTQSAAAPSQSTSPHLKLRPTRQNNKSLTKIQPTRQNNKSLTKIQPTRYEASSSSGSTSHIRRNEQGVVDKDVELMHLPPTAAAVKTFPNKKHGDEPEDFLQGDDPSIISGGSVHDNLVAPEYGTNTNSNTNPNKNASSSSSRSKVASSSTSTSSNLSNGIGIKNGKQRNPLQIRRDLSRLIANAAGRSGQNGASSVIGADDEPLPNKCDRLFMSSDTRASNGTFESPTMISEEGHLYQCIFMFVARPMERVEVVFTQFNVRGTPPECVHEWVDIWTETEGTDPTDLVTTPFSGRYCGKIPPRRRISLYGGIAIGFYSDKNSTDETIFRGTYAFITDSPYQIGTPVPRTLCSYTILGASKRRGDLISPTYPGVYPKNLSCSYKFVGIDGQRIRLEFRDFDVFYGGAHCPFDEVKVFDGMDPSSPLIGTYCGQQRNLVVFSSAHLMLVTFTTLDRSTEAQNRGFKGVWEFSESFVKLDFIEKNMGTHIRGTECDQRILSKRQSNGVVYSPNYPFPYVPKIVCRYFVYGLQDPQDLERVRLSFEKFDVITNINSEEDTTNQSEAKKCGDGFLKVYLKGQEVIQAYDKADYEFCGKDVPHDVVSDGPRLVLVFSSGEAVGSGFKAKYVFETEYRVPGTAAPDGSCHFTYYSTSRMKGEFNSPRFPSNYPSMTNCTYMFFQQPNEQVRIVFDNFKMRSDKFNYTDRGAYGDLCEEDWVEVYNVISDAEDRLVGRYCGSTAPGPIESREKAQALKVILHTDTEGVSSGFKARYIYFTAKTIFGECGQNITQAQSGVLTSPKWPQKYDGPSKGEGSATCNWYLSVRPGSRVMLHFQNFAIEGEPTGRGCPAAAVRIWVDPDGVPVELCGESLNVDNSQYVSARNLMRVTFITADKAVGAAGFRAVWTEVQEVPRTSGGCHHSYFRCEKSLFCIPAELKCDGISNCGTIDGIGDQSDEDQCGLEFGDFNTVIAIVVGVAISLFFIVLVCAWGQRRKRRRRRRLQLRRPPIHVCDNAGARFAAMDSV